MAYELFGLLFCCLSCSFETYTWLDDIEEQIATEIAENEDKVSKLKSGNKKKIKEQQNEIDDATRWTERLNW